MTEKEDGVPVVHEFFCEVVVGELNQVREPGSKIRVLDGERPRVGTVVAHYFHDELIVAFPDGKQVRFSPECHVGIPKE